MDKNRILKILHKIVNTLWSIIFGIVKFAFYIVVAILKLLLDIIKFFMKPSKPCISDEWTRDDSDFYQYFRKGGSSFSALDKDAQKYYAMGPVFFSKQFANEYNIKKQKECVKGWNSFLNHVSACRSTKTINW